MADRQTYRRLLEPPKGSFFLFGVRGVGKSTWTRAAFPQAHTFDLLDEGLYHSLLSEPSTFAAELAALPRSTPVIVDEVQRVPALLNEVHRAMETRRQRFILLGSSARRLKTAGTNLLAGRAVVKTMLPFVPAELAEDFDLERTLRYGALPVVWQAEDPRAALEAYVQLYLREEIRGEALVRNLPAFVRFLPVAALFHGQTINVSGLARDTGASRTTVEGYVAILEDTLVAFRLPAFEAKLRMRERKHPRLFWVDPGLVRAAKRQLGPVSAEERGPLFEGWVLSVIRAHNEVGRLFEDIAYWAPAEAQATEVDFLLRRGREFLAIGVKTRTRVSADDLAGLKAISSLPGLRRRILLYLGARRLRTDDGIDVWPLETWLDAIAADRLWP
jgi:predicted AAA+ superfamily ATPase